MKVYGHPWSINTRKVLLVLAEKGTEAELVLVMIPKGEQKQPEHLARNPFGKVPVLEDDGFVLYESRAINRYLDRRLAGPSLSPQDERGAARLDQWTSVADLYFAPHAGIVLLEGLFRRFLGGAQDARAIETGRSAMGPALDAADRWLARSPHFAGEAFSLADVQWMPYFEYLTRTGLAEPLAGRPNLVGWWERVSERPAWKRVARTGPQPYDPGIKAEVIEQQLR